MSQSTNHLPVHWFKGTCKAQKKRQRRTQEYRPISLPIWTQRRQINTSTTTNAYFWCQIANTQLDTPTTLSSTDYRSSKNLNSVATKMVAIIRSNPNFATTSPASQPQALRICSATRRLVHRFAQQGPSSRRDKKHTHTYTQPREDGSKLHMSNSWFLWLIFSFVP